MSKEPIDFLQHIADEYAYIISVSNNLSKDELLDNETLKRAIVRSLEVIMKQQRKFRQTSK